MSENLTKTIRLPSIEHSLLQQFTWVRQLGIEPGECYVSHDRFEALCKELGYRCDGMRVFDMDTMAAEPGLIELDGVTVCDESLHPFPKRPRG